MKVFFGAALVMFLWAICYPLILLTLEHAPLMKSAFYRAFIAGVVLVMAAILLKRPLPISRKQWLFITITGLTATSIGFWGMFYAGGIVSPGLATVLTNTQPLIATTLGWFILREKINKLTLMLIILGFLGILVVSSDSLLGNDGKLLKGTAFIFIAATGIAVSNVLLKLFAKKVDIFYAMGFQLLIGSIPLAIISEFTSNESKSSIFSILPSSSEYFVLIITLATAGTAIPFLIWYWLMEKAPLYRLNIYSFLTPVFGLLLGWYYFEETLTITQWVGVIIVALAVSLIGRVVDIRTTANVKSSIDVD